MNKTALAIEAKTALLRRGLTITRVASDLGISREHLSLILHGHRPGSDRLRGRIARRLPDIAGLLHAGKVTRVTSVKGGPR